ncbi:MAG: peptidylprolyl isomerase [Dehalococcoidia bacterium]|jgi:peptidylprolyl isomerase
MSEVKTGDTVQVHYTGRLETGEQFDSSKERDPLQFTLGNGELIPGFENAVIGMNVGDVKTIQIPSQEAYGPYMENMKITVDKAKLPEDMELKIGMNLTLRGSDERKLNVRVIDIAENTVTMDANHPLAGKDLMFDIELVKIL